MTRLNWVPVIGRFEHSDDTLIFKGGPSTPEEVYRPLGTALSNCRFSGGHIAADATFVALDSRSACELVVTTTRRPGRL